MNILETERLAALTQPEARPRRWVALARGFYHEGPPPVKCGGFCVYGTAADDLSDEEILGRLLALNLERARGNVLSARDQ